MKTDFAINGTLKNASLEYRGDSGFPILQVEVSTGEKFFQLEAVGQDAHRLAAIVGDMPAGSPVQALGRVDARISKAGKNYSTLSLTSIVPDTKGTQGNALVLMGRIAEVVSIPMKNGGEFKKAQLEVISADRQGVITGTLDINFSREKTDASIAEWENNLGALVEIQADMSAWVSEDGRSFPRFYAREMSIKPMPGYLTVFSADDTQAGETFDMDAAAAI